MNSKYKSPGAPIISQSGSRFDNTFMRKSQLEPGPGTYNKVETMNETGSYFLNKFRNSGAPVFAKSKREVEFDNSTTRKISPGPGTYRMHSEFGFYEDTMNNVT